jgi:hypothetical protein
MSAFLSRRLFNAAATAFFVATGFAAFVACGSGRTGTGVVPERPQQAHARHVSDTCKQYDPAGNCLLTPPPVPACNDLSPGMNCFDVMAPPTPNPAAQYIDQFGNACDPLNPKKTLDGSMQICTINGGWDSTGTLLMPVHAGIDLSNYQPQCMDIYGGLMNSASYHQCYKMRMWIN